MIYYSVVSLDTVRIGFLMTALKNLENLASDIQNAFLEAPTKENIFFFAGDEWKSEKEKFVIVVRSIYGIKSSALHFPDFLAETLGKYLVTNHRLMQLVLNMMPTSSYMLTVYYL